MHFKCKPAMDKTPEEILDCIEKHDSELAMAGIRQATSRQINALIFLTHPHGGHTCTYTLVAKAVEVGKYDIVKLLVEKGADVNEICRKGSDLDRMFTPLSLAVKQGDEHICKLLLEHGAYIGLPCNFDEDSTEYSSLQYVLMTGKCQLLRLFFERGGQSLATEALLEYIRLLDLGKIQTGAVEDVRSVVDFYRKYNSNNKTTEVFRRLENDQFERAIEMIKSLEYEDINRRMLINDAFSGSVSSSKSGIKWTLLTYAVKKCRADVAEALIDRGADVKLLGNNLDFLVFSPFTVAVQTNNIDMCKLLLNKGANPNYPWCLPDGESVIGRVLESDNAALLKLIFSHGVTPECGIEHVLLEKSSLVLSLDVLKILLGDYRPSAQFWWVLVTKAACDEQLSPKVARARHIIKSFLSFMPCVYRELLDVILDHPCSSMFRSCEWLWGRVGKVPSLKHISRYAVRLCCDPCTPQTIGRLDLPVELLDYMIET